MTGKAITHYFVYEACWVIEWLNLLVKYTEEIAREKKKKTKEIVPLKARNACLEWLETLPNA